MANIFDPTGQQLLEESARRIVPSAPAVPPPPVSIGQNGVVAELPDEDPDALQQLSDQTLVNDVTQTERLATQAAQLAGEPTFRYRPLNAMIVPTNLSSVNGPPAVGELALPNVSAPPSLVEDSLAMFGAANANRQNFVGMGQLSVPTPTERWQVDYDNVNNIAQERARRVQAQANANIATPFVGVTQSINSGAPFGAPSVATAQAFLEGTLGVSLEGIGSPNEPVSENTLYDRLTATASNIAVAPLLSTGGALAQAVLNAVGVDVDVPTGFTPDDTGTTRRILGAAARVAGNRVRRRVEDVGPMQFLYENTFQGLGERAVRSRVRAFQRGQNPVNIFQQPQEFVGTGLNFYGDLSARSSDSFFAELAQESPDLRNLLRDLQPQLDAAGNARFNPGAGYFGDFGNAGALSALLYLANIPEGLIAGALYDIGDLTRLGVSYTPAAGLLSRINPIWDERPTGEQLRRIDTLTPFLGRDRSFTQEWSEYNYMAFIDNPALEWLPDGLGLQTGLGFVADMILGGVADMGVDTILRRGAVRASRQSVNVAEELAGAVDDVIYAGPSSDVITDPRFLLGPGTPPPPVLNGPTAVQQLRRQLNEAYRNADGVALLRRQAVQRVQQTPQYNRAEQLLTRLFGQAENLNRRLDQQMVTRMVENTGVPNVVARQIRDGIDEGVVFDLLRFDSGISNGRRALRSVDEPVSPSAVGRAYAKLVQIEDEIRDIDSLIDEVQTVPVDVPEEATVDTEMLASMQVEQLTEQRTNYQRMADRLRSTLSVIEDPVSYNEINYELLRTVDLDESGLFVAELPASFVAMNDLAPLSSRFAADSLLESFVNPIANAQQFSYAIRSDESLQNLAKLWGDLPVVSTVTTTSDSQRRLAEVYATRYLRSTDPNLYRRSGKSIPDINGQTVVRVTQVDGRGAYFAPSYEEMPAPVIDVPEGATPKQVENAVRKEIENTSKYHQSLVDKLNAKLAKGQPPGKLPELIEEAEGTINRLFSEYPSIAQDELIEALPDSLRPAGAQSQEIAEDYVVVEQTVISSGQELQRTQADLIEVEQVVSQLREELGRMPQLQRVDPADEMATRRMAGQNVPFAVSEKLQPIGNVDATPGAVPTREQATPEQIRRVQARSQSFSDERIGQAILSIRADNAIDNVDFEPDVRALTQITRRVDRMTYRQMQEALKAYPGVKRSGKTDELRDRLLDRWVSDYRTASVSGDQNLIDKVYSSIGVELAAPQPLVLYHGTKAADLDIGAVSMTNEYGIALYTDVSPMGARPYAKAQPAEDLMSIESAFRVNYDGIPKVFEIQANNSLVVNTLDNLNPLTFNVLDLSARPAQEAYTEVFSMLVKENHPNLHARFKSWSKNKHPREYMHYFRSQLIKENQGQQPLFDFMQDLNYVLRDYELDALKDGSVVAVLTRNWQEAEPTILDSATGTMEEALRYRIAVDQELSQRIANKTTEAIATQDELAMAVYTRNNLRNAVADQEQQLLKEVEELGETARELDQAVVNDNAVKEIQQQDEMARDAAKQGSSSLRNNDLCL